MYGCIYFFLLGANRNTKIELSYLNLCTKELQMDRLLEKVLYYTM